jgi:hypothetical protein
MRSKISSLFTLAGLVLALFAPATAHAGPPLICHPYEIGAAKSLPGGGDWNEISQTYDRKNLVRDTLALLRPDTPIIVRMETLRRAAIYAAAGMRSWDKAAYTAEDRALAAGLIAKLRERTQGARGDALAIALFDIGFFAETLRQARLDPSLDGYALLAKAAELRPQDAEIQFALALASSAPKRAEQAAHLANARAGAKSGTLLAVNIASHFAG